MTYEEETLRAMSVEDLRNLYDRAMKLQGKADADVIIAQIEAIGLPTLVEKITLASEIGQKMQSIVFSEEAKEAAVKAALAGKAPLGVIDPMLRAGLGADYQVENECTVQAGYLITNMMRQMFWKKATKSQKLPSSCVAKSGALFIHSPPKTVPTSA